MIQSQLIPAIARKVGKGLVRVFNVQVENPLDGGSIFSTKLGKFNQWNELLPALAVKYPVISSKF